MSSALVSASISMMAACGEQRKMRRAGHVGDTLPSAFGISSARRARSRGCRIGAEHRHVVEIDQRRGRRVLGRTISHIAGLTERVYGFDSFEGLPEDWRSGFVKGAFAGDLPPVPPNAVLIKGWFEKTLPEFLGKQQGPVAFLHIDCDLYSSTKTIFDLLAPRIVRGTVIVFDEYFNYPGWQQHEHKAFEEFKSAGIVCKPIGFVPSHQQVGFIVTKL
jgi:hypothetical protein